jgi:hypothetical protein
MYKLQSLTQGHPVLAEVVGISFVIGMMLLLLLSLVLCAQFCALLLLRAWGITFARTNFKRVLFFHVLSALCSIFGIFVVRCFVPATIVTDVLLVPVYFVLFFSFTELFKKKFPAHVHMRALALLTGLGLSGLWMVLFWYARGYALFMALPLMPVGLVCLVLNYLLFVKE